MTGLVLATIVVGACSLVLSALSVRYTRQARRARERSEAARRRLARTAGPGTGASTSTAPHQGGEPT